MPFFDSFWNRAFYHKGELTFVGGVSRVLFATLVFFLLIVSLFYVVIGRTLPEHITKTSETIVSGYPDNLILTLENGTLSSSPMTKVDLYPYKGNKQLSTKASGVATHFVSIDTTSEATGEVYSVAPGTLLLARNGFIGTNGRDVSASLYTKETTLSLNKERLRNIQLFVDRYAESIPFIIIATVLIGGVIFYTISFLVAALLLALIVMLLSVWLTGKKRTYKESYLLVLYVGAVVILIKGIISFVPIVNIIAFIPFSTFIGVLVGVYFFSRHHKEHHHTS